MKPMLASKAPEVIRFPVLASPKIDGVRALITRDGAVSRSLKPIRNKFVQAHLDYHELLGLDGELVVGSPTDQNCMQNTTSGVMRESGEPDFVFYVFDNYVDTAIPYTVRAAQAQVQVANAGLGHVRFLVSDMMRDQEQLDAYEARCLADGYEGVMIRDPNSPYKYGRSSAKEGYLLKVKRFQDDEAVVIGVEELMHNENEAKTNALGRTERSTAKAGLVGAGTLGKLIVRDVKTNVEFGIGTGFTAAQRADMWADYGNKVLGKLVTYKHFANAGVKDAPRFPVFKAFRDASDM